MGKPSPFGQLTRMRVLEEYFKQAGDVTVENAWEHVYRCLLWMDAATPSLAHIYDSNHMARGGVFHHRAVKFTEILCEKLGVSRRELKDQVDYLFKGCIEELKQQQAEEESEVTEEIDEFGESELAAQLSTMLEAEGIEESRIPDLIRQIESTSRWHYTVGNKRKNALGEGFEDLLWLLMRRVAKVPEVRITLRRPVSELPGFRKSPIIKTGARKQRQPHPDIALHQDGVTHVIGTAKWSMRQDRETQFASEYTAYQRNKVQSTELIFALITNEFDVARLTNVAAASPVGAGGYIFHQIYHIAPDILVEAQGERIREVKHWIGTGKILSLCDFLTDMKDRFGTVESEPVLD